MTHQCSEQDRALVVVEHMQKAISIPCGGDNVEHWNCDLIWARQARMHIALVAGNPIKTNIE